MLKRFDNSERTAWRSVVERVTLPVRRARAARLRARSAAIAKAERRAYLAGCIAGDSPYQRRGDRLQSKLPRGSAWHEARATGAEEVFRRVEDCGDDFHAVARCTSDSCRRARQKNPEAGVQRIPLGCSSRLFCDECKVRIAARFRREFNASRHGILWGARLQGRMSKWRPREGKEARLGERLITLTVPELGTGRARVNWIFRAWPEFLKRLNEYHREQLETVECTSGKRRGDAHGNLTAVPVDRDGCPVERVRGLCHTVRVFEWTPGADGVGHPHFHVWHFGPYIPHELIAEWWQFAWARASRQAAWVETRTLDALTGFLRALVTGPIELAVTFHKVARSTLLVDVRKVIGDDVADQEGGKAHVANELVKYLTKDWYADPEVFGDVYAELIERRARQTSRGFAAFQVAIVRICETCGCLHESETGFRWTIEAAHGESLIPTTHERSRAPPEYEPREKTDHEIVADLFEEAYLRRTQPERVRVLAGLRDVLRM